MLAVGAVLAFAEPEDCDGLETLVGCLVVLALLAIPRVCELFRSVR